MVAGALSGNGYHMGESLYPPRDSNPKGYFESREINQLNAELIATGAPLAWRGPLRFLTPERPDASQSWLALKPLDQPLQPSHVQRLRIRELVRQEPFCYKDPRFCYTVPWWLDAAPQAGIVCVFRHPGRTVASILKEARTVPYMQSMDVTEERCYSVWCAMYLHVLELLPVEEILFVHVDQMFSNVGPRKLERYLRASVDTDFPEKRYQRSRRLSGVPDDASEIYERLCTRADYQP